MTDIPLTAELRAEYQNLFDTCVVRPERQSSVDTQVAKIQANQKRYQSVSQASGVPWHVIGSFHSMECGLRFDEHLHNGDPLTAQTVHVPAGRPPGSPPFTWEESAEDALQFDGLDGWSDWSVPGTLYRLEKYNGFGYRKFHPDVLTPYLWSFSTQYTSGKYTADGHWDASAVSQQCGAAVILRRMAELGIIDSAQELPAFAGGRILRETPTWSTARKSHETLRKVQVLLNSLPNIYVPQDGRLNTPTLNALHTLVSTPRSKAKKKKKVAKPKGGRRSLRQKPKRKRAAKRS